MDRVKKRSSVLYTVCINPMHVKDSKQHKNFSVFRICELASEFWMEVLREF